MAKLSLSKSIEAAKLNKRTGLAESGPESTIPFGALVDHLSTDRDVVKFSYLGEHYRCPESVWKAAAHPAAGEPAAHSGAAAAPAPSAEPAAPAPRLAWQAIPTTGYPLSRAKAPGGWLVTTGGAGLAFVPDPGHEWDGVSSD